MRSGAAGAARRWARACARCAVAVALAACVTTVEEAPLLEGPAPRPTIPPSLTIPFGAAPGQPGQQALDDVYRNVLRQLQEAATERDPATGRHDVERLGALLAQFDRDDLPLVMRERLAGYRGIARGLRFCEQHAARTARFDLLPPAPGPDGAPTPVEAGAPALGAPLRLQLRLPAPPEPTRMGAADDDQPCAFLIESTVRDTYAEGSERGGSTMDVVRLPDAFTWAGGADLLLPVTIDLPVANAVQREVQVRVSLLPGYVQIAGELAPVPQTLLAATTVAQWPVGYGVVAKAPLAELQAALRAFEPRVFPRVWLAAAAVPPGPDRETAITLLLDQVRFGRADQARVAMAALRRLTGESLLVGDREAWLAWSQTRR